MMAKNCVAEATWQNTSLVFNFMYMVPAYKVYIRCSDKCWQSKINHANNDNSVWTILRLATPYQNYKALIEKSLQ